ncbi:MoaD/ThiS family protein [Thioalkalivibrio sp. HK1]|uniref:MoaD/ThiS family protein n=1 Tax=Thioalkalivibrio sp. HK1 TaxID=1469245 RepID=UPI0004B77000|nr:MoaD/ThiS family protein [Thioalkalivibrio sp. HK1]
MSVRVVLSTGTGLERTGGCKEFEIEARTMRELVRKMDQRFPGLGAWLEEETAVAINGEIHDTVHFQPLPENAEVFFLPKIEAG